MGKLRLQNVKPLFQEATQPGRGGAGGSNPRSAPEPLSFLLHHRRPPEEGSPRFLNKGDLFHVISGALLGADGGPSAAPPTLWLGPRQAVTCAVAGPSCPCLSPAFALGPWELRGGLGGSPALPRALPPPRPPLPCLGRPLPPVGAVAPAQAPWVRKKRRLGTSYRDSLPPPSPLGPGPILP